jgi:hypothetical protein
MLPAIFSCTISIAIEIVITPKTQLCNRVSQDAFAEA